MYSPASSSRRRATVRHPEQRGRVHVVAARVHDAFVSRGVRERTLLQDGKAVDVGTNHDTLTRLRASQDGDRTGVGGATVEFPSEGAQPVRMTWVV